MRFFFENIIDRGEIEISSDTEEFPKSNIQVELRTKRWKTTGVLTQEYAQLFASSTYTMRALIIANHDFDGSETLVRLQGNGSPVWTSPSFTNNVTMVPGETTLHMLSPPDGHDYWRFVFTKSLATDIRSMGRMFLGDVLTFDSPSYFGWDRKMEDLSTRQRSEDGQVYALSRSQFRRFGLDYTAITDARKTELLAMFAYVGTHTSFFFQINEAGGSGEWAEVIYCKFSNEPEFTILGNDAGSLVWNASIELEESL